MAYLELKNVSPLTKARSRFKEGASINELKEEIITTGCVELPKIATLELTLKCNLLCKMCYRKKEAGEMSTEEVKTALENAGGIEEISIIGGEVFLRSDIFEILDFLELRKIKTCIKTNGTLIGEDEIKAMKNKVQRLDISLDGSKEVHNRIRGSELAFEKALNAIRLGVANGIATSITTVAMKENINEIEKVFSIAEEAGVCEIRIEPEMFSTNKEILETQAMLGLTEKEIGANINTHYGYSANDFIEKVSKIREQNSKNKLKIRVAPKVVELHSEDFFGGKMREAQNLFCKHALTARINPKGELLYCYAMRKKFGSLLEKDIAKLWNSEELKEFRKKLFSSNLSPLCIRCCRLRSI